MPQPRLRSSALAAALVAAVAVSSVPAATAQDAKLREGTTFELTVLQTNDLHGHLDDITTRSDGSQHENSVAKYSTIIDQVRAEEENVLLLDGGDLFLRGEFQELQGELEAQILKEIHYDAMTIGNNDFRVYPAGTGTQEQSLAQLKNYQTTVNFPILLGNVVTRDTGDYLPFVKPYAMENYQGVKVGVIGVTSMKPELRGWDDVSGLDFIDPVEALEGGLIKQASAKSDVNIVLSHAGNPDDHRIARVGGVDAVIGADTHLVLRTPETEVNAEGNIVPITQAGGEQEHYLGRLDLTFQVRDGEYVLTEHDGYLYDLDGVQPDPRIVALIEKYRAQLKVNTAR